jgi:ketosteroid isomerase-like protein
MKLSKSTIGLLTSMMLVIAAGAQISHNSSSGELYNKLAELDSVLFANVYTCNSAKSETFFTDDLEFYHDKGGVTRSRKSLIDGLKNNFCGEGKTKLRRELVKGSLEVYPINNYGAIQTGEHRFYITENGQETLSGIARFAHVWKQENGEWRISRVFSYDHHAPDINVLPVLKGLSDSIAQMDSELFEAFNAHNAEKLKTFFTNDLEFYHDKGGLTDYHQTDENFKKMFQQNNAIKRELIKSSFEVCPIKDYGAIETGSHKFCHLENGKEICGTFQFIILWQKNKDEWKISRIISYDH